jgi:hypothetical protein
MLEDGHIEDSGTYEYLIESNSTFRKMAEQKTEYDPIT